MKRTKLAARYAKALFEFAGELGQLEAISSDMELIDNTFDNNPELRYTILSPIIKTDKKSAILQELFREKVGETTLNYLKLILKKGRELQLDTICSEYVKIYKAYRNIVTLDVFSAYPLEKEALEKLKGKVAGETGAHIELKEHIKPELIGGVVIKYGDYLVDASIQHSIATLRKQLTDKSYQVNF
ncbi:MAG: ATP synthase F1 subunit delta [Bacteroidales bacterium]|nr:ATP synthase F1 subunit delta [Bacteroidales bacterium]